MAEYQPTSRRPIAQIFRRTAEAATRRSVRHSRRVLPVLLTGLAALFSFTGCDKKSGDAVVVGKEHIAAAEISATPGAPSPSESPASAQETPADLPQGTIAVDAYVMKPEVRGTSRDPRALDREQWIVKVKMISDLRVIRVQADQAQFGKLKEGDRVKVAYKIGKYTGTVWDAEIR